MRVSEFDSSSPRSHGSNIATKPREPDPCDRLQDQYKPLSILARQQRRHTVSGIPELRNHIPIQATNATPAADPCGGCVGAKDLQRVLKTMLPFWPPNKTTLCVASS